MLIRLNAICSQHIDGASRVNRGSMQKTARTKRFGFLRRALRCDIGSIRIVQLGDRESMEPRGVLIQIATGLKA